MSIDTDIYKLSRALFYGPYITIVNVSLFYYCNIHYEQLSNSIRQQFLPRCMKCRRGLAMRILSVCPSVCHTRIL